MSTSHWIRFNNYAQVYLKRVTPIRLAINHIENFLLDSISSIVSSTPIVCCAATLGPDKEVLWIVNILIWAILYTLYDLPRPILAFSTSHVTNVEELTYSRLQIEENCTRYVSRVVTLGTR